MAVWDWLTCVCGKKLCRAKGGAVVSSEQGVLAIKCRACKREVFLTVRQ